MSNEERNNETLLLTIRAQLEREENRRVIWMDHNEGPWNRIDPQGITHRGLIKYFEPAYQEGFDPYGSPIAPDAKQAPIQPVKPKTIPNHPKNE